MYKRNQIRLRHISKFNNCTIDNLKNRSMFQCSKCHKFNTIMKTHVEQKRTIQNCQFCANPNYTNK